MNLQLPAIRWAVLAARIRGMFNLNDPRWGRGDDKSAGELPPAPSSQDPKLSDRKVLLVGLQIWMNSGAISTRSSDRSLVVRVVQAQVARPVVARGLVFWGNLGFGVVLGALVLVWLGTGFFIVQEGQQAVITQFGKYKATVGAGFNWRMPWPVQRHELVYVSQIRSVDIGRDNIIKATGLRESAMLTEDENIVEIKFAVQYRLNDARAYLFESKNPTEAVVQAAETAVREVVGKMKMDSALAEERDQIAPRVRQLMQTILDRYKVGIEVVGINLQQGGVRPPEQVQSAFDDVLKAGQERERAKNEAQAYANDVVPRAVGAASRLKEEANAYRERIVAQAEGDAQRFKAILPEYQKAPQVTRDRLYTETFQQVYSNVTKVLVDSKQGSNLLYLPLDKILQQVSGSQNGAAAPAASGVETQPASGSTPLPAEARSRENQRSRDRETR